MGDSIERRYTFLIRTSEAILAMGFIIDFCFRQYMFPTDYRSYALIPFIISLAFLLFSSKCVYDLCEADQYYKRFSRVSVASLLNITFIVLIIFAPNNL